ncbi:hypothetical protein BRD02_05540 [Halobacteriales archaeon QS_8_69_73]|nr:MAG: hypothetical protein BRD02_05540 [Halobacteriales archaeon QS_8_69_73]
MNRATDPAEQAAALVADPELYERFAADYDDEVGFYSALRGNAQRSLSFEEYVELRRVFLDRGPTAAVRRRLEERLDRSLKNMILGDSPRGRAYSVSTLRELAGRRRRFGTLEVTVPTLLSVVKTTVEHLYDEVETPVGTRETLADLLSAVPSGEYAAVEYVARAWLTEVTLAAGTPTERLSAAAATYAETVPTPDPPVDGERSAPGYLAAAAERSFVDPEKRRLHEAAVHDAPSVETICGYLYLTATRDVEAYRHGDDDVTRAEFILARRHLQLLCDVAPYAGDPERAAYVESYLHLARAIEAGGGRWLSTRAGRPEPAWWTVADEYARAATAVRSVDAARFVKYLSKAVRHAAHAVDEPASRRRLHVAARRLFERLEPATMAPTGRASPEEIESAVAGTIRTHRCREHETRARLAFEAADYGTVRRAAEAARAEAAAAPQGSLQLRELDAIETVAAARRAERRGDFETALERYDAVATDDDSLRVGVACHRQLCRVKRLVIAGRHEEALAKAHEWFDSGSTIVLATEASCGLVPDIGDGTAGVSEQFLSVDAGVVSALPPLVRLAGTGGAVVEAVRRQIEECLVAL